MTHYDHALLIDDDWLSPSDILDYLCEGLYLTFRMELGIVFVGSDIFFGHFVFDLRVINSWFVARKLLRAMR